MNDSVVIDSKILVKALDNVISQFYSKRTSNIFIAVRSSLNKSKLTPDQMAGEILRNNKNVISFIIENNVTIRKYERFFNIFLIDSYESFK